jgi:hypothetical protein
MTKAISFILNKAKNISHPHRFVGPSANLNKVKKWETLVSKNSSSICLKYKKSCIIYLKYVRSTTSPVKRLLIVFNNYIWMLNRM